MAEMPYLIVTEKVLAANGGETLLFQGSTQEEFDIYEFNFYSTGAFNVTGFRVGASRHLTNANNTVEIPSTVLQSGANSNRSLREFRVPLTVKGGETLYIDVEDTSGAGNTIGFVFNSIRRTS